MRATKQIKGFKPGTFSISINGDRDMGRLSPGQLVKPSDMSDIFLIEGMFAECGECSYQHYHGRPVVLKDGARVELTYLEKGASSMHWRYYPKAGSTAA
jgi:hypothetical protein